MKYTIDEIIDDKVKLIDVITGNIKIELLYNLPNNIKENDVVIFKNNEYIKDANETINRIDRIKAKMEKLKKGLDN
ncbi:MAG: DUF3006 domain-containing protein [Bacilli bacterium]|nr:DUF3006 domain-containing protein [Bacilli bacterium]